MAIISVYPSTIWMVSNNVSPLTTDDVLTSPRLTTSPPKRFIAVSNDILVRVLGSKNKFPSILPCSRGRYNSPFATGSSLSASSKIAIISSLVKSSMVISPLIAAPRQETVTTIS